MRQIDPHFQYGKVRNRPYLDAQHKQDRVTSCGEKLQVFEEHKPWVVYVDEKVMCLSQCCTRGWYSSDVDDFAWSMPRLTRNRKTIKLKYIIGVNYQLGPVWIKFFTGTTGMPWNRPGCAYLVSSCHEQLWGFAGSNVLHCLLQGCCPAHGAAAQVISSTWVQPQHTEPKGQCCCCQCLILGLPDCQCVTPVVAPAILCIYVLLPLHLNQQAVWLQQHGIPPVPVQPQPLAAASYLQLYLFADSNCLNCIPVNSWRVVQQCIQQLLMLAAPARAHVACEWLLTTGCCLQCQQPCVLPVAALALEHKLERAVCCLVLQQHVVKFWHVLLFGFLMELPPRSAAASVPLLLCRCLHCCWYLQTTTEEEATGMTAAEYEDCIWDLNLTLDTITERWRLGRRANWRLSQDNSTAHTTANLRRAASGLQT
jgi:hypothetical protein